MRVGYPGYLIGSWEGRTLGNPIPTSARWSHNSQGVPGGLCSMLVNLCLQKKIGMPICKH